MSEQDLPCPPEGPVLCLLGTSRPDGNTRYLVDQVLQHVECPRLIDIGSLSIAPYDYDHHYDTDDFSIIADAMDQARVIIFATPVYWYTMSAQMKIVFDRLSDLTETRKPVGKRLAGKTAFAVINGGTLPEGFMLPFSRTAGYFNMDWGGSLVVETVNGKPFTDEDAAAAATFARQISTAVAREV